MNKKLARILSLVLVLCTLCTQFPLYALAADGESNGSGVDTDNVYSDLYSDIFKELEGEVTDVATVEELEAALAEQCELVRVTADMTLDRTLYVTHNTVIYSTEAHTLTRAADFGGDLFVVGESEDGTLCEEEVTLAFGDPASATADLLKIDGNASAMTVSVTGSAIFVTASGIVDIFANATFTGHVKVGNEKTLTEKYGVSYPVRVGGAVAIVAASAEMNIYGGKFTANGVNEAADDSLTSIQGGVIYNFGTTKVYGGTFDSNRAYYGGVFFNYRKLYIYRAMISNNSATEVGGAIYMPNSTGAFTYIGEDNELVESAVTFAKNSAGDNGGAIYARNYLSVKNALFTENSAPDGGAILAIGLRMSIDNSAFAGNTATATGGAIKLSGNNGKEDVPELTISNTVFEENAAGTNGGAIHVETSRVYATDTDFVSNTAAYGGAIFEDEAATVEIDGSNIQLNSTTKNGGAVYLLGGAALIMNNVYGYRNSGAQGGFLYAKVATLTVFGSVFEENEAKTSASGAFALYETVESAIYGTEFKNNKAATNAGAVTVYTGNTTNTLFNSCTFTGNTSGNYGGALHISGKSQVYMYATVAKNNEALYGGFMYETAAGTVVTVGGLTVSGNKATNGPTIWGNTLNADMYLDKTKYLDLDVSDDWDDAYWAATIANKLTVIEGLVTVPSYTDYDDSTVYPVVPTVSSEVTTAAELERALAAGLTEIVIKESFVLDRTFYVVSDTVIRADKAVTLTRAADFGGELFVIGELADGTLCENEVTLTLGTADGEGTGMLTLDGNGANMTASVVGSLLFLTKQGIVNVYGDVTVQNHLKVGNEKTLGENYSVSYPARVGGSVAIVTGGAEMNIYGGLFTGNGVNTVKDTEYTSTQGGLIYNYSDLNIYGGIFENNSAYYGGAFFNYRRMHIYSATVRGNSATEIGGAIYTPNSTGAYTYIGEDNELVESGVTFSGNTSGGTAGAIYARHYFSVNNALFEGNTAASSAGAIYAVGAVSIIENSTFRGNDSRNHGGAVVIATENGKDSIEAEIRNCLFESNTAKSYGGALYVSDSAVAFLVNTDFTSNSSAYGGAFYANSGATVEVNGSDIKNNSASDGGAVYMKSASTVIMNNVYGYGNTSSGGGFLYSTGATLSIYNSTLKENSSTAASGALALFADAASSVYATVFEGNTAATNAGAVTVYTGNAVNTLFHGCTFTGNTSGNYGGALHISGKSQVTMYLTTAKDNEALYGGFMYETAAGTVVTVGGLTVSGNTATNGPTIWGNTLNANMYLDKAQYTDLDHTGAYDSAYWNAAIKNKLTVTDQTVTVPKYLDYGNEPYEHMKDAVDVASADELEAALKAGVPHIRIVADFEIDRTFYVTYDVVIFSTIERRLTRAKDFAGDIFVVGEDENGTSALLLGKNAKLTLGNPLSVREHLLTVDGNSDNMEVDVTGSVMFICRGSDAALYPNLTVENCLKVGNVKALEDTEYDISNEMRVGGSMAVVTSGVLDIYGGTYRNNGVNNDTTTYGDNSNNGGLIFNRGTLTIYDGLFENNVGARGGVIYNYTLARIYSATFRGNNAGISGGALYCPSTSGCHMWLGTSVSGMDKVLFEGNSAKSNGGAIYSSFWNPFTIYGNTEFIGNHADQSGGAICTYGRITATDVIFRENTANNRGGAIYASNGSGLENKPRIITLNGCTFEANAGLLGGAIQAYSSSADYPSGAVIRINDCTFTANEARPPEGSTSAAAGGAIHADRKSNIEINGSLFKDNTSTGEAGAIYAIAKCVITLNDTEITGSVSGGSGGAISARSVYLNINNSAISGSVAKGNGGAIYVSYSSAQDINTVLTVRDSEFLENTATSGGAIYATRHAIEKEHRILDLVGVTFSKNVADNTGGAVTVVGGAEAYLKDLTFTENTANDDGGALCIGKASVELDTATFTANHAKNTGGAIYLTSAANAVFNKITASENTSGGAGGCLYAETATFSMYNSTLTANHAGGTGGAMALYDNAVSSIYNTVFDGNISDANGGAITAYTGNAEGIKTLLHSCTFKNNSADNGGGAYISGKSIVEIYNVTAEANTALKGGFLYVTTTGTAVTLNGASVSGNTASAGGPIIWGNSTGAALYINKANYTDAAAETLDSAYWSAAIYNALTVTEITSAIPTYRDYQAPEVPEEDEPVKEKPIPVAPIFELAKKSSDSAINSTYGKFPKLDNSSNFMSKGQTRFENINGETVTVDSFIYPPNSPADNVNFGQGTLIFQAMLYKQAHPEEEVYIDAASYRFSVQAAVNINRDSRYFGYMRQLVNVDYDAYGFVRIAYLLVCAAKMGIHVNIVPHIDAYPLTDGADLVEYFTARLDDPCDPAYVADTDKVVGDYLAFNKVYWTVEDNGGTDMMHTKLCAVSHYLDMNGEVHRNAVFSSSANLDGIYGSGKNANWKLQTATIVSDHEEIYRTSVNYLRLVAKYAGQEDISEFRDYMYKTTAEQARLILAGKADEIPDDEQLIYLGTENDDVFELYFTPFGGGAIDWDEINNPYCKYMRKLYESEDYICFAWNAAEYTGDYPLGRQLEDMLIAAFHENRNPKNKVYGLMENFDATAFDDLVVGVDIGYKSFNVEYFGTVHNKDIHMSYVENGQRYYVSLLNSLNQHGGSMSYQSNFALVIKEKTCSEDSVYYTITKNSVMCEMIEHTYGEEIYTDEVTEETHGSRYHKCEICGDRLELEVLHLESEWIVLREAVPGVIGLRYKKCTICGCLLTSEEIGLKETNGYTGAEFTPDVLNLMAESLTSEPRTIEAVLSLPKSVAGNGGVIFGNYGKGTDTISLEMIEGGRVTLRVVNNGVSSHIGFKTDIRSDEPVHIAIVVRDNNVARLFINGVYKESCSLKSALPTITDGYAIGGDFREKNAEYFKGTLYSLKLFDDVRSMAELAADVKFVPNDEDGLMFSKNFSTKNEKQYVAGDTLDSISFTAQEIKEIAPTVTVMPHTFEALVQVAGDDTARKGVIISNYGRDAKNGVSLEIYTGGKVRFFVIANGVKSDCVFDTAVLSKEPVHIAVSVEGKLASLYVNGVFSQSLTMNTELPESVENFAIGGDYRSGNAQYFKGSIYSVNLFADARTAEEVQSDVVAVDARSEDLIYSAYAYGENELSAFYGQSFAANLSGKTVCSVPGTPLTIESVIMLPKSHKDRGGVIIGNYCAEDNEINLEIYTGGKVRLYYAKNGYKNNCIFSTDIRSDAPVHVAVTVEGRTATLYVNGEMTDQRTLVTTLPVITGAYTVGGDARVGNAQYFKGKIYSVGLYDTVKTQEEIRKDMIYTSTENAMYSASFIREEAQTVPETSLHAKEELFVEREVSAEHCGLLCYRCAECGEILRYAEYTGEFTENTVYDHSTDALKTQAIGKNFAATPKTFEFVLQLDPTYALRAGALLGNYDGSDADQLNIEVYSDGVLRLYYKMDGTTYNVYFTTDLRSEQAKHVALVLDGLKAYLYVDGALAETATLTAEVAVAGDNFCIGTDNRVSNKQLFAGHIYSVHIFEDVRTAQEIANDAFGVVTGEDGLLYAKNRVASQD